MRPGPDYQIEKGVVAGLRPFGNISNVMAPLCRVRVRPRRRIKDMGSITASCPYSSIPMIRSSVGQIFVHIDIYPCSLMPRAD
jgi:hypothetical protein